MASTFNRIQPAVVDDEDLYRKYLISLDEHLLKVINQPNVTFNQVISKARGAFPTIVLDRLKVLGIDSKLQKEPYVHTLGRHSKIYPELHPLDFEWYFTNDCAEQLSGALSEHEGAVLCLGAPTVASSLARLKRKVYLADNNALLEKRLSERNSYLQFILWDLSEPLPLRRTFPIVFFDGPWYLEAIKLWLWQAARAVSQGGLIAFSLFPSLLRPAAERERIEILSYAEHLGQVEIKEGVLEYETPLFEKEALSRSGIKRIGNWRHGDLVQIHSVKNSNGDPPKYAPVKDNWSSFVIGSQVIKLRNPTYGKLETVIEPLDNCPDYIYSSVSLRDARRNFIDLWTSRNRVARVGKRGVMFNVLRHLSDGLALDEIKDLPILSYMTEEEREGFHSNLRLILGHNPEGSHDLTHGGTEVL